MQWCQRSSPGGVGGGGRRGRGLARVRRARLGSVRRALALRSSSGPGSARLRSWLPSGSWHQLRAPPEGSAESLAQTRTPPCALPPPPSPPAPPPPRPAQSPGDGLTDTHYSPEPGAAPPAQPVPRGAVRPWGWACAASALRPAPRPRPGAPAPKSPPCSPPPGSPRPRPARTRRRAAARARGEGRAALAAPGVTALQPAAPLPKHTAGLAGEPRRGTRDGRGHQSAGSGGKGGPGAWREGLGPAPSAAPPGPSADNSLKEKAEKGTAGEAAGGRGRIRERKSGEEREGS
ncbi:translation initiation factor IF-2-like [Orcinus orca]|uniref:translation initiation factor IF-2-like n=1 Tax=Orcinus orca TaxID=9733 RepID=UPI0014413F30|nr:translation initiation factor IF-2-like [Orcinus orca]